MSRTNDTFLETRWVLEALFRVHGGQLVDAAHLHLGSDPREAADIVQDLRREVLEGKVLLPRGPGDAVRSLFRETIDRCARRRLQKAAP